MIHFPFSTFPLPSSIFCLPSSIFRFPFSTFHLPSSVFHFPFSPFHLPSSVFHFPFSPFHLPSSVFHLPFSVFLFLSSVFRLPSSILKRAFDTIVSLLVITIALPLWLVVAIAIKLDSPGPVFYRGQRVGKDGKLFAIYKFRTMVVDAPNRGPGITHGADPRITRVGRFLRKLKIDEMPQLINVLKGEMSIVGPRPEDPRYVAHYTPEQRRVLSVRPGMASPAFIKYRHEEDLLAVAGDDLERVYLTQVLPDKLRMDMAYIDTQSFLGDLAILVRAAISLFTTASVDESEHGVGGREGGRKGEDVTGER